jgi:hypothetical protein
MAVRRDALPRGCHLCRESLQTRARTPEPFIGWEGVMPLSDDPKARANQLANLRKAPPAPKGHRRTVKHGARAQPEPRRQAAIERQICDALPVRAADGGPPVHDMVAVRLLAVSLCRLETVAEYVSRHGMFFKSGRLRPAADHEQKLIERCANLADRLGMTPTSRAKLGLDLARTQVDLATLMSDATDARKRDPNTIEGTATDA